MGEPGSKIVLTILTRLTLQFLYPRTVFDYEDAEKIPFASAGDDQILIGPLEILTNFSRFSLLLSLKPSAKKWIITKHAGTFCEQLLYRGSFKE